MQDTKKILDTLLNELIYIMGLKYKWSFHTLTLHITDEFNKKDLKDAIDTYFRWIKIKLTKIYNVQNDSILYLYTYELNQELHLHIHIIINQEIAEDLKDKLLKDWNEYNGWPWYNKRSLLIKNNNEYDIAVVELVGLEYRNDNNRIKIEKELENAWIILNYIIKDILDIEKVIKLNYILYPLFIINGSVQKKENFDIVVKALQNLYKKNIYDELNKKKFKNLNYILKGEELENPFLVDIEKKEKLNYIYEIWKNAFEIPKTEKKLLVLLSKLNQEEDVYKKQLLIEAYINDKQNIVNEIKLYTYNKDFTYWNELLILNIKKKIKWDEKAYNLILNLENIDNTIYYVLETLVKIIRYFKKETNILNNINIEDIECAYTEAYFKSIIREIYILNIITKNLIDYKNLYKKEDKEFLLKMQNMPELIKVFILKDQDPKIFYKDSQKEIESSISIWIDLLLEILYEIQIIQKVNEVSIYIADKRQNYFILTDLFIKYIIEQEYTYEIIPPVLLEPKEYEIIDNNKVIGGYHTIPNILFSKNENLKYKISLDILNIINKSQKFSLSINEKYLNYILNSKITKIEKLTNLNFDYYIKYYIDKSVEEMKQSQEMFLIYEFFLSLYIAEFYKKQEFWFITKLDERGRKYDIGYPLNFYRDKILRNLFVWNREKTLNYIEIPLNLKLKQYDIYRNYIQDIHKEKEYNIFHILESPLECLVGFDAKNQIYQIIGGLVKDKKLLELSKVIKPKDQKFDDLDIYSYFLERLKIELWNNVELKTVISIINSLILNYTNWSKSKIQFGMVELLDKLDRTWIKDVVMTYGYNKSTIELISTTDYYLLKNIFNNVKYAYIIKQKIKEISVIIVNTLIKDINQEVQTLSNLKIIFNSLVICSKVLKNSIIIALNNTNVGFSQYYLNIENVTFQKWRKVNVEDTKKGYYWKKVTVTYPKIFDEKETKTLNFKKNLNALLPNTCHYIDSLLLYNSIKRIIELKIPIKTIHDSFYTNIKYKNEISTIYREAYISIFKNDVLEQIIQNALNEFLLNNEFFELIYKFNGESKVKEIPFDSIKNWKLLNKKQLKELKLNKTQQTLYKCIVKIYDNYMIIYKNELMQIDFEKYCQENKNEKIIL